jgi:hypothetical protein
MVSVNPHIYPKMPFDPVADVAPVTLIARSPWVIVITPSVPAKDLKELVACAKANPGKLRFGSSEPSSRLAGEQFKQLAGIDLQHVPYKGGSQIMVDMLGGHIETGFTSTLTVLQHYKSGKLRVVAIAGKSRHPSMPDVRTAIEAGYRTMRPTPVRHVRANTPASRRASSRRFRASSAYRHAGAAKPFGAEPIASTRRLCRLQLPSTTSTRNCQGGWYSTRIGSGRGVARDVVPVHDVEEVAHVLDAGSGT